MITVNPLKTNPVVDFKQIPIGAFFVQNGQLYLKINAGFTELPSLLSVWICDIGDEIAFTGLLNTGDVGGGCQEVNVTINIDILP